ncbi:hypothetical protein C8Q80DRAFT_480121 [Daedaleopsis nitida]|nr:hypothetical protein C8Q80DRAFT_480121 [Daedaleopsis nitida]
MRRRVSAESGGTSGTVATLGAFVAHAWQRRRWAVRPGGEKRSSLRGGGGINQTLPRQLRALTSIAAKKCARRSLVENADGL